MSKSGGTDKVPERKDKNQQHQHKDADFNSPAAALALEEGCPAPAALHAKALIGVVRQFFPKGVATLAAAVAFVATKLIDEAETGFSLRWADLGATARGTFHFTCNSDSLPSSMALRSLIPLFGQRLKE
jgi:hypothetical protein